MQQTNSRSILLLLTLFMLLLAALAAGRLQAQARAELPAGFALKIAADGLDLPVDMLFMPDGNMLVAERGSGNGVTGVANIRLVKNGVTRVQPVISISTNVMQDSGLDAIAIDRDFANNGYIYAIYAPGNAANGWTGRPHVRLSRFTYDFASETASVASELILIETDRWAQYHHGHALWMDADGYLFVGFGDIEAPADQNLTLNLGHWEGKLLRIRPNATGYTIPADNPYVNNPSARSEIYARGLRNPYRIAQRASDGLTVIGDVGGIEWEEANVIASGANYGWPQREGTCPRGQVLPCAPAPSHYTDPLMVYPHNGEGRAITGVAFYDGDGFPAEYHDHLFVADVVGGTIGHTPADNLGSTQFGFEPFMTNAITLVDLEYRDNSLYALSVGLGVVYIIYYTDSGNVAPSVALSADNPTGAPTLNVNFTATAVDPDDTVLRYRWNFGDGSPQVTTSSPTIGHSYTADGTYTASVVVTDLRGGESLAAEQTITVYSGEFPTIGLDNLTDAARTLYHAGDTIAYSAERSTIADLDADTPFSWRIDFHHNTHIHPYITDNDVFSDTLSIPTANHDGDHELWYKFVLTMKTATGQEISVSREVFPQLVDLTFLTAPAQASMRINFVDQPSPHTLRSVVGIDNTATAGPSMLVGDAVFVPDYWEWGGMTVVSDTIAFPAPETTQTYRAVYRFERPADRLFLPTVYR